MSSAICGRCAATALRFPRRTAFLVDDAFIATRSSLTKDSNYRVQHFTISSSTQFAARRYASSSSPSQRNKQPKTSSSSSSKSDIANVNPPSSTLPAELNLPPRDPSSSSEPFSKKASRYLAIGRAYLGFYKTGLKNVYSNYKESLPIRRTLGLPSYIPTSPPPRPGSTPTAGEGPASGHSFLTALETLQVNRAEFQLVRRAAYDVRRMIPFGLLLIICGEFTPLVVLAVGDAVVPYTCRVPQQLEKTRKARLQRKQSAFAAVQGGLGSVTPIKPGSKEEMTWLATEFGSKKFVESASAEQILRACAAFGLVSTHERASWLVSLIYRKRLMRWTEYLELDDRLLVKGGGVGALNAQELRIAVEERGGVGVGSAVAETSPQSEKAEKEERQWLSDWLKRRKFT